MTVLQQKITKHWTEDRIKKITSGKKYVIRPDQAGVMLHAIGILNNDASMSADNVRKFIQINHMLSLLEHSLKDLAKRFDVVRIFDIGCGNSYLSLILAWYFIERLKHPCQILGIDRNKKVIENSEKRATLLGFGRALKFFQSEINLDSWQQAYKQKYCEEDKVESQAEVKRPHLVLALHACDTATDYAVALGIKEKADVIAVVPCCQAEVAKKWSQNENPLHPLKPVFDVPNFRREIASQFTDVLRFLFLRSSGYEVTATEFVLLEHSHKNRLILAERRGNYFKKAKDQYEALKKELDIDSFTLENLLS